MIWDVLGIAIRVEKSQKIFFLAILQEYVLWISTDWDADQFFKTLKTQ